jgi:hypothetical protein
MGRPRRSGVSDDVDLRRGRRLSDTGTQDLVETRTPAHSWRATIGIGSGGLHSISCPTSSTCAATGNRSVLILASGRWRRYTVPTPRGTTGPYLQSIDCPKVGACVAVGSVVESGSVTAWVATGWMSHWTSRLLGTTLGNNEGSLQSVSFVTVASCVAVGWANPAGEFAASGLTELLDRRERGAAPHRREPGRSRRGHLPTRRRMATRNWWCHWVVNRRGLPWTSMDPDGRNRGSRISHGPWWSSGSTVLVDGMQEVEGSIPFTSNPLVRPLSPRGPPEWLPAALGGVIGRQCVPRVAAHAGSHRVGRGTPPHVPASTELARRHRTASACDGTIRIGLRPPTGAKTAPPAGPGHGPLLAGAAPPGQSRGRPAVRLYTTFWPPRPYFDVVSWAAGGLQRRRDHRYPGGLRSLDHPGVIGNQPTQVVTQLERGGQVQSVESPQQRRLQTARQQKRRRCRRHQ